jgi:predicted small lipoprotein YifL
MSRAAFLVVLVLLFCAGCGQKGPLYLRDKPPASVKPPRPEPFKPLPYPNEAGENEAPGSKN